MMNYLSFVVGWFAASFLSMFLIGADFDWPVKLRCALSGCTPVYILDGYGRAEPGYTEANKIGNLMAHRGWASVHPEMPVEGNEIHYIGSLYKLKAMP